MFSFIWRMLAKNRVPPPQHNYENEKGNTKGEILKRGGFEKTTVIKIIHVLHFQKTSSCFFSITLKIQMVVFMNSILNLIWQWFHREENFSQNWHSWNHSFFKQCEEICEKEIYLPWNRIYTIVYFWLRVSS